MIEESKLRGEYFEQLGLNLQIEEEVPTAGSVVSPEEAARRSALAQSALDVKLGETIGKEGEKIPLICWREDYEEILRHGWPWRVAAYVAWASSPRSLRWPKSQDELAKLVLGLTSDRVISQWRKKNAAIDELISLLQSAPLLKHRRDIYEALAASASSPDHRSNPDRKLALEVLGDYVPRQKIDLQRGKIDDLSEVTDEELEKIAGRGADAS